MKIYRTLLAITFFPLALNAQMITAAKATAALNSNVTQTKTVVSTNQTSQSYIAAVAPNTEMQYSVPSYAASGVTNAATNYLNSVSSRFGYYTPFYAQLITVFRYDNYYQNIPIAKYVQPYGEYYKQSGIGHFNSFWPHYKYFLDGKPGYIPYVNDKPASVNIEVGVTKPVPLQVNPSDQSYYLFNTRFVRTFSLTY